MGEFGAECREGIEFLVILLLLLRLLLETLITGIDDKAPQRGKGIHKVSEVGGCNRMGEEGGGGGPSSDLFLVVLLVLQVLVHVLQGNLRR